jgi:excisionase family DNA binding protein
MENQEYMTLEEASAYAKIKRATIYNYLHDLKIETFKAGRDRRSYITRTDAQRLKEYKEAPWKVKVETRKRKDDTTKMKAIKPAA